MPDGNWPWIIAALAAVVVLACLYAVVRLLRRMRGLRGFVRSPDAPGTAKAAYYGAWIYALSPVDLLPDPILIDDVGVVLACVAALEQMVRRRRESLRP
ncbi:YkvA family protein [Actinocorallia populi]|uniref:DUF1232 domain-containing protein n=1 Tax=Actinocorallia populi TaxID=2079200 RepID=UPI000D09067D|nr:DUF1232 domain-containing protein [Actinocorallia populi]